MLDCTVPVFPTKKPLKLSLKSETQKRNSLVSLGSHAVGFESREFTCQSLHCFVSSLFSSFRSWSTPKLCKKKLTNYLENWTEHLLWQTNWFFGFAFGVFSWSSFQIWPCVHDHFNFAGLKVKLTLIFFDPNAASHCCRMQEKMSLVAKLTNT